MKTAEEMYFDYTRNHKEMTPYEIQMLMKEYAEQVAENALEDASEQAECIFNENAIWGQQQYEVSKYSITSTPIQLP